MPLTHDPEKTSGVLKLMDINIATARDAENTAIAAATQATNVRTGLEANRFIAARIGTLTVSEFDVISNTYDLVEVIKLGIYAKGGVLIQEVNMPLTSLRNYNADLKVTAPMLSQNLAEDGTAVWLRLKSGDLDVHFSTTPDAQIVSPFAEVVSGGPNLVHLNVVAGDILRLHHFRVGIQRNMAITKNPA